VPDKRANRTSEILLTSEKSPRRKLTDEADSICPNAVCGRLS